MNFIKVQASDGEMYINLDHVQHITRHGDKLTLVMNSGLGHEVKDKASVDAIVRRISPAPFQE